MSEAGADEFAEFGAAALDAFQDLFEQTKDLDHRTNDEHARELISDLLVDLMHYAERRQLEFNDIVAEAEAYYLSEEQNQNTFAIGSPVQLEGPAADEAVLLGLPTRGTVAGVLVPRHGFTEYYVRFLGDSRNQRTLAADLEPAPPFPATTTTKGVVTDPLKAEQLLVEATARMGLADVQDTQPNPDDLQDHRVLLDALTAWNGMEERDVTDLLLGKVAERLNPESARPESPVGTASLHSSDRPTPPQLAAQAFPMSLSPGIARDQGSPARRPANDRRKPPSRSH